MNRNALIGIIAVIIVAGVVYMYSQSPAPTAQAPTDTTQVTDTTGTPADTVPATPAKTGVTITYTKSGFSPKTVTVKVGTAVTFVNQSSNRMWVASDPHPTHEGYAGTTRSQHCPDTAGTAFDECASGTTYTFTFGKVGTWGYHNHVIDEDGGTVIVTQ